MEAVGESQEFTFVTDNDQFYQGALTMVTRTNSAPGLSSEPKSSRENAASLYRWLPANSEGGHPAQLAELIDAVEARGAEVVEIYIHQGKTGRRKLNTIERRFRARRPSGRCKLTASPG